MKVFKYTRLLGKAVYAVFAYIVAIFITRKSSSQIWLVSERGSDARDNGYWFFIYMNEKHPEIQTYYVINRQSNDYHKLKPYKSTLIEANSFNHFIVLAKATHLISTHVGGYLPYQEAFLKIDKLWNIFRNKKRIFLQHGVIKDMIPRLLAKNVNLDLFCCGAKMEYDYISENYGFNAGVVQYTGLCRYDSLNSFNTKEQILIMPTWRTYIDKNNFELTEYFKRYSSLLLNQKLHCLLENTGLSLVFYPHHEIQSKIECFKKLNLPSNIIIADTNYDVQTLLKESKMLITDFSSVYFDMAYMSKPVIMYQFDHLEFRSKHYQKGYLNEEDLGKVTFDEEETIKAISECIRDDFKVAPTYQNYVNQLFEIRDSNNCSRVFNAINHII